MEMIENLMNELNQDLTDTSFNCHNCGQPGYKTDGESKVWCKKCLNFPTRNYIPVVKGQKVGRNNPCPCGSNKKNKNCCNIVHLQQPE